LARLPDGRLVVCQNGGSSWGEGPWPYDLPGAVHLFRPIGPSPDPVTPQLQVVDRDGRVSTLTTTFVTDRGIERPLVRPSDLCVDRFGGFYVTDGGTTRGRTRELTGLLYGTADGELREVLHPLEMPNGVALAPDGATLYVAETRTRRIWAVEVLGPGEIGGARGFATVPSGGPLNIGGADGICVDREGRVVVATLGTGGVTVFEPDGSRAGAVPLDDPMTTNAALSPDGRALHVVLASSGRVVTIDPWGPGTWTATRG
jgi:gluconolactonase